MLQKIVNHRIIKINKENRENRERTFILQMQITNSIMWDHILDMEMARFMCLMQLKEQIQLEELRRLMQIPLEPVWISEIASVMNERSTETGAPYLVVNDVVASKTCFMIMDICILEQVQEHLAVQVMDGTK